MENTKRPTFVFYSTKPSERVKSRLLINRHVSRLEKEKREKRIRQQRAEQDRPGIASDDSSLVSTPSKEQLDKLLATKLQPPIAKVLGASSYYPFVPTSDKPSDAWAACHRYLDNLIWHDNGTLGLNPKQGHARVAAMTRWALSYDLIFHALVAWTLCCLPESQDSNTFTGQRLLFHRSQTLKKLHEQLSKGVVDDVLIQGVGLLIPIDDHLGYTDFTQAHLDGIERMVQRRGGIDQVGSSEPSLGLQLASMVSISTTKLSINTASAAHKKQLSIRSSATPALFYPFGAIAPSLGIELNHLPQGFSKLVNAGKLSIDMIAILAEFQTWLTHLEQSSLDGPEPMAYRFSVPSGLVDLEKHICTALICLTDDLTAMGLFYAALIFRKPLKRARMLLDDFNSLWADHGSDHDDVLVWLATVITTPRRPDLMPVDAMRALYGELVWRKSYLREWENVKHVLRKFFYSERRVEAWRESWEDFYSYSEDTCATDE